MRDADVREVGADVPRAGVPRISWQPRALGSEDARRCARRGRGARRPAPVREPGAEPRRRLGEDVHRHVRVLQPAELGALAAVAAGRRRRAGPVRAARDHVDLPVQLRHPEAVDDVVGAHDEQHAGAHRDVDLVRGDRVRAGVAHLPPPLVRRSRGSTRRGFSDGAAFADGTVVSRIRKMFAKKKSAAIVRMGTTMPSAMTTPKAASVTVANVRHAGAPAAEPRSRAG